MIGRHVIRTWSSTQPSVTLSSGEAEFYGLVKAAGEGLGHRSIMRDFGLSVPVRVWTDSSAALGISISAAIVYGFSNIFVKAPSPENLGTLFEFIMIGLDALNYKEHQDYEIL